MLNAGIGDVGDTLADSSLELIDKVTRVNYVGVMLGLKHAQRHMPDSGSIICTSSMAAHINLPGSQPTLPINAPSPVWLRWLP